MLWNVEALYGMMYFSVKINIALRERIFRKIGSTRVKSISVHPLGRMTFMLDFICMVFADL